MKFKKKPDSLKFRLILALALLAPLVWLTATLAAFYVARDESNELFDTQQALFARQLLNANFSERERALRRVKPAHVPPPISDQFAELIAGVRLEQHALGFAVRSADGRLLLADGEGETFPPPHKRLGFVNMKGKDGHHWRLFYMNAPDGSYSVAVGQSIAFRNRFALELAVSQLVPWLAALPVWMLLMVLVVGRGLAPVRSLAESIRQRRPDDSTALADHLNTGIPSEIKPLTEALNTLFTRVAHTLEHERRFTADAAHELRTPLAALKVQAEVLELADDAATRRHAIKQLLTGIERANRLVEQLLALSRLDPLTGPAERQPIDWRSLAEQALFDVAALAAQRAASVQIIGSAGPRLSGDATLLTLLLRNLLDNALRYAPPGAVVRLVLSDAAVAVEDNGPGIAADQLARVRERFYRPPGQEMSGSGLGLSIVERVASLHSLTLQLENRAQGGLAAWLELDL